jgi:hypothetical protein
MAPKQCVAVDPQSPPAVTQTKRVRKTTHVAPGDAPEAPGSQLSLEELSAFIPDQVPPSEAMPQLRRYYFMIPRSGSEGSLVKTMNEFYNRMQVVFCCLYYRCHHYSEGMMQALIEELNHKSFT